MEKTMLSVHDVNNAGSNGRRELSAASVQVGRELLATAAHQQSEIKRACEFGPTGAAIDTAIAAVLDG